MRPAAPGQGLATSGLSSRLGRWRLVERDQFRVQNRGAGEFGLFLLAAGQFRVLRMTVSMSGVRGSQPPTADALTEPRRCVITQNMMYNYTVNKC